MCMTNLSTRIVKAEVVLAACERYFDRLQKHMLKLQEPHVLRAMKPRWFGLVPGRTREEAISYLKLDRWNKYSMAKLQFDWASRHVIALRELCLAPGADDVITLTSEDAEILAEYFE